MTIFVGILFNSNAQVTKDVVAAAKRDGAEKTAETLGSVGPGVLRALLKRHRRQVINTPFAS